MARVETVARGTLALAVVAAVAVATCGASRAQDPPEKTFAVRCGTLFTGRGEPIVGGWLVVRDGKVAAIAPANDPPRDLPIVDASDRVVMPGIVAADSELAQHPDAEHNVTPDFVALDGFDFEATWRRALAAGVTTAYLSPGRNRLVSGQGSVVKLAGDDAVARVLRESACLRINVGASSTQAPPVFEPTIYPTADDPLEPARRQFPSARISQLATLRNLFAAAARDDTPVGAGGAETRYDPRALRAAARGDLPLRIAARTASDVQRALALGEALGQRVVVEDPAEIEEVAPALRDRGARLVLRIPVRLGASNPGGENRRDRSPKPHAGNAGIAEHAGLVVALAPVGPELDDYLLVAGLAVRHGMSRRAAIESITSASAEVLDVSDRVGSLEPGRDADFVVLGGDPLAVGTMVEETWIDGVRVHRRDAPQDVLAIRCARILPGEGGVLRDGVVLVAGGRIKAVGEELAIPYGARVIDLTAEGGVMTPGFVDAESRLGLAGDGTGVPDGTPSQRVAQAVRFDDPAFGQALDAGITTVLVCGNDTNLVGGRVAALKTGAADASSMVLDPIAGQRFTFDEVAPDAIQRLAQELDKGQKYLEAWQAYEKALADWKAGKGKKPEAQAPTDAKPADDPVSGTWTCEMQVPQMGIAIKLVLDLTLAGNTVTGSGRVTIRDRELPAQTIENGKFENGELRLTMRLMGGDGELVAKLEADKLTGKVNAMGSEIDVTGTRTAKPGDASATPVSGASDDGTPKKPKVEEALEPLRELVERGATAIVRSRRAPAIEAVVKLMTERKVRFVLRDADDAVDTPAILGAVPPPVMLGPNLVGREDGEIVNLPARLADAGVGVAFATGDHDGTRWLPVHAMHAIRWGLDPATALRAITIEPAKAFGLEARIGSIQRGKDADLVVFSGNPFEPTSRVLLVVCNGRVVRDARAAGNGGNNGAATRTQR